MACIDSFAIHARVLEAFLWDKRHKSHPDDALAIDFFEVGEWEAIRERVQRSALYDLRDRAGHEVAHLSYKRVNKPEEARRWKFDVIAGVIGKAFRPFLEYVAPELLCDSFEDRLRATWPGISTCRLRSAFRRTATPRRRLRRLAEPPGHQPGRSGNIRGNAPAESALTRLTEVGSVLMCQGRSPQGELWRPPQCPRDLCSRFAKRAGLSVSVVGERGVSARSGLVVDLYDAVQHPVARRFVGLTSVVLDVAMASLKSGG